MILSQCGIGDNVKIKINGNITVARILQKGRKCLNDDSGQLFAPRYRFNNHDIKVNYIVNT